jgi:hypothetical protein
MPTKRTKRPAETAASNSRPPRTTKTTARSVIGNATRPTQRRKLNHPTDEGDEEDGLDKGRPGETGANSGETDTSSNTAPVAVDELRTFRQETDSRFQQMTDNMQAAINATITSALEGFTQRTSLAAAVPTLAAVPNPGHPFPPVGPVTTPTTMLTLPNTAPVAHTLPFTGFPPGQFTGTTPTPTPARDILSVWDWVDRTIIESIVNGSFDIQSLPKLQRDESARQRHTQQNVSAYVIPLDGNRPELLQGVSKLHKALADVAAFLSAWLVYVSIRTAFSPERASALIIWLDGFLSYHRDGFLWNTCLNYFCAYFRIHQNGHPNEWLSMDPELVTRHLSVAQRSTPMNRSASASRSSTKPHDDLPLEQQICRGFNKEIGCKIRDNTGKHCQRKHICSTCNSATHKAFQCRQRQQ